MGARPTADSEQSKAWQTSSCLPSRWVLALSPQQLGAARYLVPSIEPDGHLHDTFRELLIAFPSETAEDAVAELTAQNHRAASIAVLL